MDLTNPVIKATVTLCSENTEKKFTGYGDANSSNVAKKVAGALIRMAETRAVARALRFACNIDMTAIEELDAPEEKEPVASTIRKTFGNKPVMSTTTPVKETPLIKATETVQVTITDGKGSVTFNNTAAKPMEATIVTPVEPVIDQKNVPPWLRKKAEITTRTSFKPPTKPVAALSQQLPVNDVNQVDPEF